MTKSLPALAGILPPISNSVDLAASKSNVRYIAAQLGFDDCRIAAATRAPHADDYLQWVKDGKAGDMKWLERNLERRCDPREVLPGAQSVITLALNYFPGQENPAPDYRIARYAWNDDYHDIIEDKLRDFDTSLQDMGGTQRYYTDTGPVLERDFATEAGLGWNGKSTVQIHTKLGTWFFLAELLTTLDLEPDKKQNDHCGKCTACMTACPTNAIPRPHHVDAPRCISYLTIEHKGPIPEDLRPLIGDRIYGCDDCLDVCPWNKFAKLSRETRFHARETIFDHSLRDFLSLTVEEFRTLFAKSPIKRIKRERFLRNVCVALGNTGSTADLPALQQSAVDPDPLISEHASWAIAQISERGA
ncbi:MAG: tRNA epoxyqueuosine(34) reductase QueG [Akkermansiaceae bacterium]|nr:tRNA epoxyqueuosine(34) reductase QueG [Akkermansiaceae bacterium]